MGQREAAAKRICHTLRDAGYQALFAGGCVRDHLLRLQPSDYDIATDARPEAVCALFHKTIKVGAAFGVIIVVAPEGHFEVATFRGDGPYLDGRHPAHVDFLDAREDALRRDFTINALFLDPATGEIIDFAGGQQDLEKGLIRAVGDPAQRFQEDHLRLLRAVRFAARLGYTIEPKTQAAITALATHITKTSAERIRDELLKMLTEGNPRRAFELMDETGLLQAILPEIAAMKGVEQPPQFHPEGDVFTHTLMLLEHLHDAPPTLAMAALLHDVAKPLTQTFTDRIRFNHHDKAGARLADAICRRLRFSNPERERIAWLIEQHMRVALMPKMRESKRRRLVREEGFDELLELARIDCLSSHRKLDTIEWIEDYRAQLEPEEIRPKPLLTGNDLKAMGYVPGPLFSEILHAVEDAQLEERLTETESARQFVRENWPTKSQ